MWLNAHCRIQSPSLSYVDLLNHFRLTSVSARRSQHDIMFIRNVFSGRILSSFLLQAFCMSVPCRMYNKTAGKHTDERALCEGERREERTFREASEIAKQFF